MKQGAKCPKCGGTFTKLKNRACPLCSEPLRLERIREGQTTKNIYILVKVEKPVVAPPDKNKFFFGSVKVYQVGEREWETYVATIVQKLVCPNCKKAAVHVPTVTTGSFSHQCDRCRHITRYYFKV